MLWFLFEMDVVPSFLFNILLEGRLVELDDVKKGLNSVKNKLNDTLYVV